MVKKMKYWLTCERFEYFGDKGILPGVIIKNYRRKAISISHLIIDMAKREKDAGASYAAFSFLMIKEITEDEYKELLNKLG